MALQPHRDFVPEIRLRDIAEHANLEPARFSGTAVHTDQDLDIVAVGAAKHRTDDLERQRLLDCGLASDSGHVRDIEFWHGARASATIVPVDDRSLWRTRCRTRGAESLIVARGECVIEAEPCRR